MKKLLARIAQIFEDQAGALDEKRIVGVALVIAAIAYFFTRQASYEAAAVGGAMLASGLACFGVSVKSDQIAAGMVKANEVTGRQFSESDSVPQ